MIRICSSQGQQGNVHPHTHVHISAVIGFPLDNILTACKYIVHNRLGVGAKYLSHSKALGSQSSGSAILTTSELKLKRQLKKNNKRKQREDDNANDNPKKASLRKESDTEDSRAGSLLSSKPNNSPIDSSIKKGSHKKKSAAFLDQILGARKKKR